MSKKYIIINLIFVFLTQLNLNAQTQPTPICGYEQELKKLIAKNPNYIEWQNAMYEKATQERLLQNSSKRRIVADTEYYEIPVVFHIVYKTAAQNLSDAVILSQLNALNLDFRKLNADTSGIRSIFKSLAADARIQFKLATTDPNGNATTGITRTFTNTTTFATGNGTTYTENMKRSSQGGIDAWNPQKYLNIWICNMDMGPGKLGIVYGFAIPPTGAANWNGTGATRDNDDPLGGVVLHFEIVGVNNPISPANVRKGNTATHELGHYLGLRHIWGDGFGNCQQSDGIFDTPFARQSNTSCNPNINSCIEAQNDMPDNTENYMDYTIDACAAMFTKQQVFTMRYVLENLRTELPFRKIIYDTIPDYTNTNMAIFPNPQKVNKNLNINITSPSDNNIFTIRLIDALGQIIEETKVKSNRISTIQTETYAQGLYFVILLDKNGATLIKQKIIIGG